MIKPGFLPLLACLMLGAMPAHGQDNTTPSATSVLAPEFDSGYRPSEVISSRMQRGFLDTIRWSVGAEARDQLAASFAERNHTEIWQELVAADGLKVGNVADALTAYWVINWVTANGAYGYKVDNAPVQRQLQLALAGDSSFLALNDQARQQMAEGYMLNFLLEHAMLNDALARQDLPALRAMAAASAFRFQQQLGVNLLALMPGAEGFEPRKPLDAAEE